MKILVIGSGGREHALAWKLKRDSRRPEIFCAPGNAGTATLGTNLPLKAEDLDGLLAWARQHQPDLTVVGPEAPLCAGITDRFRAAGLRVFGPCQAGARLEGSKQFSKDVMEAAGVPTARSATFTEAASAKAYVRQQGAPIVVKADGLAAGKGVVVAMKLDEAEQAIQSMFAGSFGDAGAEVVVEDYLDGEELSFFALCDGARAVPFAGAQDHKRVGDGDVGPNTGGMGAYSPPPLLTPALSERVMREIVAPTVAGMAKRGAPFRGVLFVGLMVGADGPKLIEFNVRFGDPEAEAILARLDDDLLEFLVGCARGAAPDRTPRFSAEAALTVIMAARGYPGVPQKGTPIRGLEAAARMPGVSILHAGTRHDGEKLVADGGRVLAVTALGRDVAEAQARAYAAVDRIDWPGGFCRRDIGWRAVAPKTGG